MVTETQITRHLDALKELHKKLDPTKYKAMAMTAFRKKYSIQAHTFKAMYQLDYIQKTGANKNAKYRWGPRAEPQPHDARRIINLGLELKRLKKALKMDKVTGHTEASKESKDMSDEKTGIDMSGALPKNRNVYPKPEIVPLEKEKPKPPLKKYVAAEVKPGKPVVVEEESKSILWGLYKYTKIKRK